MMTLIATTSLLAALNTPLPLRDEAPRSACELHADAIYLVVDFEAGAQERVRARVLETIKGEPKDEIDLPALSTWFGNPHRRKLVFVFDGKVRGVPERQHHGSASCVSLEEGRNWFDKRRYPTPYHRHLGDKTDFERAVIFVRAYVEAVNDPTPERLARLIESDELAEWRAGLLALAHVSLDDRSPGWRRIGESFTRRLLHDLEHIPLPYFSQVFTGFSRAIRIVHERHLEHGEPLPEWRYDAARVHVSYAVRTGRASLACARLPRLGFEIHCEDIEFHNPDFPRSRPERRRHIPETELKRLEATHGVVFYQGVRPDVLPEPPPRPPGVGPDTPWPPNAPPPHEDAPYCPAEP